MKNELMQKLMCPDCMSSLESEISSLRCINCDRKMPIIGGTVIFLTQNQLNNFFKREDIVEYYNLQNSISKILASESYLDGLKEILEFVSTDEFQNQHEAEISRWRGGDLNDPEAEAENMSTIDIMSERTHIQQADVILDWPTGNGHFLRGVLDRLKSAAQIACLDIDYSAIATLKVFLERKGKADNILFVASDARQMPFIDESFEAITAWGGFIEVPDSCQAIRESWRLLKSNCWFAGDGDIYKPDSESMKLANKLGIGHLATFENIYKCLKETSFRNIFLETVGEGFDKSLPDPDRPPLPVIGDWSGLVGVFPASVRI